MLSPTLPDNLGPARADVVAAATAQIGAPYRYGGSDRKGFGDAGLVRFVYAQAGFNIPGQVHGLLRAGKSIDFAQAKPGDLLFYRLPVINEFRPLHVGIYVGDGEMVHAIADRDEVALASVGSKFWRERLVAVIKILP